MLRDGSLAKLYEAGNRAKYKKNISRKVKLISMQAK